jgi:hypothetical protein
MSEVAGAPAGITGGQGGSTTPGATTSAPSNQGATGNAPASDWTASLPDLQRGYAQNKGWKDPGGVVDSYMNFEKLMGVPKERILKLPEKDDDVEGWTGIYDRLGRPQKPEEYNIPVPEGGNPELAKNAQGWFHEAGISRKQAEKIATKWNEHIDSMNKGAMEKWQNQVHKEHAELKTEWGQAFDQNVELGRRAAHKFGLDEKVVDKLEQVMGFAGVMKLMHTLGSQTGVGREDGFVTGNSGAGFGGIMTPGQAKAAIAARRSDTDFVKRYTAGGASEKAEMDRLHQLAYANPPQP